MSWLSRLAAAAAAPLFATGCATGGGYDDPAAGFSTVAIETSAITGSAPVRPRSADDVRALADRMRALIGKGAIGADVAVQVALANNKGLQVTYADLGLSAAAVWQETLPVNPRLAVGVADVGRTVEAVLVGSIMALMTRRHRVAIADARFRQAQLRAAEATLRLASDTRRAWIEAVAARERVAHLKRALAGADAASLLAEKLGETGAFAKSAQAREHVFHAELAAQTAEARMQARIAKERLTRLMGLWGADVNFAIPSALPALPARVRAVGSVEKEALAKRIDLRVARLELEVLALSYGLTERSRYLRDVELAAGVEIEREKEDGRSGPRLRPAVTGEVVIPIFDTGEARKRQAELAYVRAANRLAEKAVDIRSEARSAFDAYRSTLDIARHYRDAVVPLRTAIEEEALLTYNGMITSTFELLADSRARVHAALRSLGAKRAFWLADVNLGVAVHGGGPSSGDDRIEIAEAADGPVAD